MKGENNLERAEYHLNSIAALRPFAAFLLQYVKDGGDVLDPRNAPKEMHEMLELLRPLTESMSREELQLLLEKASSGKFEDELLMRMATDGEDEEQEKAPRGVVVDDNSFGEDPDVYENVSVRPGFVVKTRTNTGRKVMVNVCGAKEVPKPERWSARTITEGEATALTPPPHSHSPSQQQREKFFEEEKKAKDEDEEYIVNNLEKTHRFPLACSDVREDIDRNGNACDVYDVTFNDEVVEVAAKAMFEPLTMTTTSEYNATTTDATTHTQMQMRLRWHNNKSKWQRHNKSSTCPPIETGDNDKTTSKNSVKLLLGVLWRYCTTHVASLGTYPPKRRSQDGSACALCENSLNICRLSRDVPTRRSCVMMRRKYVR